MTSATRAMIELAITNDATMKEEERAEIRTAINGRSGGEEVITVGEAAKMLHKSRKTIHLYSQRGWLKKVTFGTNSRASGILASSLAALMKGGAA